MEPLKLPETRSDQPYAETTVASTPAADMASIGDPRAYDVLYGRGKQHRHHPGNKRMKLIIDLHREAYIKADRKGKTHITMSIVNMIKSSSDEKGGRFLKFDKNAKGWIEVSDESAREKISHAMRDGKSRAIERIDPSVLEDIPMVSEDLRQAARRQYAPTLSTSAMMAKAQSTNADGRSINPQTDQQNETKVDHKTLHDSEDDRKHCAYASESEDDLVEI